jgi:hypothetical protein
VPGQATSIFTTRRIAFLAAKPKAKQGEKAATSRAGFFAL